MPSAAEVTPEKWSKIQVLFDNGWYSVISGIYERGERRVLGERWNGDRNSPIGFPNVAGYSVWHVVPEFLEISMLTALLVEIARDRNLREKYTDAVFQELGDRSLVAA